MASAKVRYRNNNSRRVQSPARDDKANTMVKAPRTRDVLLMYMNGKKIKEIADYYGVHRKTAGRWIKNLRNKIEIDVSSDLYVRAFMDAIHEHGELLISYKLAFLDARQSGNNQLAYDCARRFETALKRRDRAIEKLGVKFKTDVEKENDELKNIIAYFSILSERLDENLFAIKKGRKKPWVNPYDISLEDINDLKDCPEMFHLERHLPKAKKDNRSGYMDRFDLEMLLIPLCVLDPAFDIKTDDPMEFALKKLSGGEHLQEEQEDDRSPGFGVTPGFS